MDTVQKSRVVQVIVTFDRVFDVKRTRVRNHGPCTIFGFQSGQVRAHGVLVPDWPRIEPGMTVTAVLQRRGDWQTLMGWVDHQTGEVVGQKTMMVSTVFGLLVASVIGGVSVFVSLHDGQVPVACLIAIVTGCVVFGLAIHMRNLVAANRLLAHLRVTLGVR